MEIKLVPNRYYKKYHDREPFEVQILSQESLWVFPASKEFLRNLIADLTDQYHEINRKSNTREGLMQGYLNEIRSCYEEMRHPHWKWNKSSKIWNIFPNQRTQIITYRNKVNKYLNQLHNIPFALQDVNYVAKLHREICENHYWWKCPLCGYCERSARTQFEAGIEECPRCGNELFFADQQEDFS